MVRMCTVEVMTISYVMCPGISINVSSGHRHCKVQGSPGLGPEDARQ